VWYLSIDHCEQEFLAITALHMHHAVYEAQERMPIEDLTVLIKGMVALRLKITTKGGVFGEDCIIAEQHAGLRADMNVNCVTFVMVIFISRQTLFELVDNFPAAKRWLERCTKILTLRAGLKKYYAAHKRELKHIADRQHAAELTRSTKQVAPMLGWGGNLHPCARRGSLQGSLREQGDLVTARRRPDRRPDQGSFAGNIIAARCRGGRRRSSAGLGSGGAAIFADVMYKKKKKSLGIEPRSSSVLAGSDPAGSTEEMRSSIAMLQQRVYQAHSLQLSHGQQLQQLGLQQLSMEGKLETMLAMLTQVVAKVNVAKVDQVGPLMGQVARAEMPSESSRTKSRSSSPAYQRDRGHRPSKPLERGHESPSGRRGRQHSHRGEHGRGGSRSQSPDRPRRSHRTNSPSMLPRPPSAAAAELLRGVTAVPRRGRGRLLWAAGAVMTSPVAGRPASGNLSTIAGGSQAEVAEEARAEWFEAEVKSNQSGPSDMEA